MKKCSELGGKEYLGICLKSSKLQSDADNVPFKCAAYQVQHAHPSFTLPLPQSTSSCSFPSLMPWHRALLLPFAGFAEWWVKRREAGIGFIVRLANVCAVVSSRELLILYFGVAQVCTTPVLVLL